MRAFQGTAISVILIIHCSCGGECLIDLESALRSTRRGDFDLIGITDNFISFQRNARPFPEKCQYYYSPPLPKTTVDEIRSAANECRAKKHELHIMDARKSAEVEEL
jgi:hypothetical protein